MRVGLVSDTHGLVDPALGRLFKGCQSILHAGDVVGDHVLTRLKAIAPVHAVRGNNDTGTSLPEHLTLDLGPVRALVLHQLGKTERPTAAAAKLIESTQVGLVVFGHSHVPLVERRGEVLFVNPGSAGPRRFSLPRCAGTLDVSGREMRIRIVDLEDDLTALVDARF